MFTHEVLCWTVFLLRPGSASPSGKPSGPGAPAAIVSLPGHYTQQVRLNSVPNADPREHVTHVTLHTLLLSDAADVRSSGQYGDAYETPHQWSLPQPHPTARHAGQQDRHHPFSTLPQPRARSDPLHTPLQPWAKREGSWGWCEGEPPTVSIGNDISCISLSLCFVF